MASVYRLAFSIASIGVKVIDASTKEEATGAKAKKVSRVLRAVNLEDTYFDLIEQNMVNLALFGETYLEKVRDGFRDVAELWTMSPERVHPLPDPTGRRRIGQYKVFVAGQPKVLQAADVIAIRVYNPADPFRGATPVAPMWTDVLADQAAARHNRSMLTQGARVGGIMTPPEGEEWTPDQVEEIRAMLRTLYEGPTNAGKTFILSQPARFERDGTSAKDMEFVAGRRYMREILVGGFGVPPMLVGNFDSATYANAKEQLRGYWDYTAKPWLLKFFGALNEQWVHPEVDENLEIVTDLAAIDALVDSQTTRVDNVSKKLGSGIVTINEARKELGYSPLPDGDKLLLPVNLSPVSPDDIALPEPEPVAPPPGDESAEDENEVDEDGVAEEEQPARAAALNGHHRNGAHKARKPDRGVARDAHDAQLSRAEARVTRAAVKYLAESRDRFVERLRCQCDTIDQAFVLGPLEQEAREAGKALAPALLEIVQDAADLTLTRIGMGKEGRGWRRKAEAPQRLPELLELLEGFNLSNPRILAYLERQFLVHLEDLTSESLAQVRAALHDGVSAGEGVNEIVLRLERLPAFSPLRAEKVGRTETIGAFNLGAQEAFRAAGTARKSWLSSRDERTRQSHSAADDAEPVLVTEPFTLDEPGRGTAKLMFPGDPEAPGWAAINCRCAMVPEDAVELAYWIERCKAEMEAAWST